MRRFREIAHRTRAFLCGRDDAANNGRHRTGTLSRRPATRLARRLGLGELTDDAAFKPYRAAAAAFRRFHVSALANSVGGGHCGPGPASIVATAAWQLAVSRYLFDRAALSGERDDFSLASKLANDSRQNLLAAHELAAREAKARPRDPMADLDRRLGITSGGKS